MDAVSRRRVEMGTRSLEFNNEHPDTDPGQAAAAAKLAELVAEALRLIALQRDGIIDVRAAAAQKEALRRAMMAGPIAHLSRVGKLAAAERHELGKSFQFKPSASSLLAFQGAARSMATEAQAHRELLVKHGLAESVLEEFVRSLDELDAAMALGSNGRAAHTSATQALRRVAVEIALTVRVMDARNRQRFKNDQQLLQAWINRSKVLGGRRDIAPPTPDDGGLPPEQEQPAA